MVTGTDRSSWQWVYAVLLAAILAGCAANPVTGQRELSFISEREEIAMGTQHYAPMKQSEGGEIRVDPELSQYVNEVGQRLAQVSDRELPYEFVVLNNSTPNAWALPGGKIAINRGLLTELNNEAELAAVLGHEIVHSAARHGAQNMERGMLLQGAMLATAVAAQSSEYAGFIVGGAQIGAQLITMRYGREAEREADYYGTQYMARAGYDPAAAVTLQETFVRLSNAQEPGWLEGLFTSHPPSTERVENNRELVANLRAEGFTEGELGTERYQQRTAFLRNNQAAYDAFDEAHALLRNDRVEEAERRLDAALGMLPQEARFHGLRADILLSQRRYEAAIDSYNQALERDPEYFDYYLGRGLAFARQGERQRAEEDLQASVNLLPTATAMNELGAMALQRNDRQSAKQYYQQAASAPGPAGDEARAAFVRLDINDNPSQYINTQPFMGPGNRLMLRVVNNSPVAVRAAVVEVRAQIGGQATSRRINLPAMNPGEGGEIESGIILPEGIDPRTVQASAAVSSVQVN